jgi:hypothetical protein
MFRTILQIFGDVVAQLTFQPRGRVSQWRK